MIEIMVDRTDPEFESDMLKEYIAGLAEYTNKIKDCDDCKLKTICRKGFNTCPKNWKMG